jgi:hypothetical protein
LFIYYNERASRTQSPRFRRDAGDGIKTLTKQGVCTEAKWPYDPQFTKKPTAGCRRKLPHQITSYQRLLTVAEMFLSGRWLSLRLRVHGGEL